MAVAMAVAARVLFFLLLVWCLIASCFARPFTADLAHGRTVFLGDSIFDVGTNQHLNGSVSRCDFAPYGVSRFKKPSGRCSNGWIIPDLVNKALGIPFSQPYLSLSLDAGDDDVPSSINFASDGSGLLEGTHADWGVLSFSAQVEQLEKLPKTFLKHAGDAIVFISSGGNDMAANLLGKIDFETMLSTLRSGIERIHGLGFRRITYSSIGPLGCAPLVVESSGGVCDSGVNQLVVAFNNQVLGMLVEAEEKLAGLRATFLDGYEFMMDYIEHPASFGFDASSTTAACCPRCLTQKNTEEGLCNNPEKYVFWDGIHPSEHTYRHLSKVLLSELPL